MKIVQTLTAILIITGGLVLAYGIILILINRKLK